MRALSNNATTRRLPPFARELAARLANRASWPRWAGTSPDGHHISIWVGLGPDAWQWAREHINQRMLTIIPPDEDPNSYDWRMLAGHDPVILFSAGDTSGDEVRAVVSAMMRAGVKGVVHGDAGKITRYRMEGRP